MFLPQSFDCVDGLADGRIMNKKCEVSPQQKFTVNTMRLISGDIADILIDVIGDSRGEVAVYPVYFCEED